MARAQREGWAFGAKTVRGAYMVVERARAQELGYESPILDSLAATHANYDRCSLPIMRAACNGSWEGVLC